MFCRSKNTKSTVFGFKKHYFVKHLNMRKFRFTNVIDNVFLVFMIFFVAFVWIKYFVYDFWACFFISLSIAIVIYKLINVVLKKRQYKKEVTLKQKKEIENFCTQLLFSTSKKNLELFYRIFATIKPTVIKDNLLIWNDSLQKYKTVIVPYFDSKVVGIDEFMDIYKKVSIIKPSKLIVLCVDIDKNVATFYPSISNMEVIFYDKNNIYFDLFEKTKIYPQKAIDTVTSKKYTFKLICLAAFNKKKTKGYLMCGLIFFVCSFFIRYSLYYVIMSSVMFVFAIISFFNKWQNKSN